MPNRYRDDVLRQLVEHGIRPVPTTSPALVRAYLNDLYRYELRQLKHRLLASFLKSAYFGLVVELRMRYPLLSHVPFRSGPILRPIDQPATGRGVGTPEYVAGRHRAPGRQHPGEVRPLTSDCYLISFRKHHGQASRTLWRPGRHRAAEENIMRGWRLVLSRTLVGVLGIRPLRRRPRRIVRPGSTSRSRRRPTARSSSPSVSCSSSGRTRSLRCSGTCRPGARTESPFCRPTWTGGRSSAAGARASMT